MLRDTRSLDDRRPSTIVSTAIEYDFDEGLKTAAINLGGSGLLLPAAIEYREDLGGTAGRFTLRAIIGVIPFVRRFLFGTEAQGDTGFSESAQLMTDYLLGPDATTGVGTSSAAEFYLDFGLPGVVIGHFMLGVLAAWLKRKNLIGRRDERVRIVCIFAIGVFAILSRYSPTSLLVKQLLYAAAVVFLLSIVGAKKRLLRY